MRWLVGLLMLWAVPALAVEPGEMLDDPVLEERAREISKGLRCPVCQNESIDESNAQLSSDLRVLLRERLVAGDTDDEAVEFIVARYGEFVLLRPGMSGTALIVWIAGPVMLLLALIIGWRTVRRRAPEDDTLSSEEETRLRELLKE